MLPRPTNQGTCQASVHTYSHTHKYKQAHAALQCHAGVSEGRPRNIVQRVVGQPGADHWFSTNESAHPAPWVELHLPHNMRLLSLQHYTFTHGHHRSSYFRCAATPHHCYHLGRHLLSISLCIVVVLPPPCPRPSLSEALSPGTSPLLLPSHVSVRVCGSGGWG